MFDPFGEEDDDEPPKPRPPFPTPTGALVLTFGASLASMIVALVFFEEIDLLALGIGEALGVGGVATFAARRVPDPQPERLGLRGFSLRLMPVLICLVPLVILVSELDNLGRDLDALIPPLGIDEALTTEAPAADGSAQGAETDPANVADETPEATGTSVDVAAPEGVAAGDRDGFTNDSLADTGDRDGFTNDSLADAGTSEAAADHESAAGDEASAPVVPDVPEGWALAQIAIVTLGISPVVEGFLFFGVILQGVVTWLGRRRGLLLTGCLYALIHAFGRTGPDAGAAQALAAIASLIAMGGVLGLCRLATGSVLAPILVDTGFKAMGLLALTSPDVLSIPGYNVGLDSHTPAPVLLGALATVGWGLWVLTRNAESEPA